MQEKDNISEETSKDIIINVKEPRLSSEDKLYVEAYLSTLSHAKAFKLLKPASKGHNYLNSYSKKENILYHINKRILLKTKALSITSDDIIDLLLQEATRLGAGSSPTARVQALSLLGKQLGLFEEVSKKDNVTYNILNYKVDLDKKELKKNTNVNLLTNTKEVKLPDNIKIENFNNV